MELLRTIAYPPGGGGGAAKCCEAELGRGAGGESRRKKAEEQPNQHAHPSAEVSRIITDPTTGKRYCRGKVLGKVMAASGPCPLGAAADVPRPGRCPRRSAMRSAGPGGACGGRCLCGAAFPKGMLECAASPPTALPGVGFAALVQTQWVRAPFLNSCLPLNVREIVPSARASLQK